jgi:hypothetical protein
LKAEEDKEKGVEAATSLVRSRRRSKRSSTYCSNGGIEEEVEDEKGRVACERQGWFKGRGLRVNEAQRVAHTMRKKKGIGDGGKDGRTRVGRL